MNSHTQPYVVRLLPEQRALQVAGYCAAVGPRPDGVEEPHDAGQHQQDAREDQPALATTLLIHSLFGRPYVEIYRTVFAKAVVNPAFTNCFVG